MGTYNTSWHSLEISEVIRRLKTDTATGLSHDDAAVLQKRYGENILKKGKRLGVLGRILTQFRSPLVFILLIAGVITIFLGAHLDATVIFIALLINVVIGIIQEGRASKAFEVLNQSQEKRAVVLRDGKKLVIPAEGLLPGDIVILETGAYVPADMRLFFSKNLSINEAVLTGEWVSVPKEEGEHGEKKLLTEQSNMAWMGTLVTTGYGRGVVVETGMNTQVGRIATDLGNIVETTTPLQQNVKTIARFLVYLIGIVLVGIFALGIFRGEPIGEMLLVSIAIAVASIPSGLPAAVTIVLALGMESILKKGGLVRSLLAAETLGSTTVILTDKTGTLTEARIQLDSLNTLDSLNIRSKESTDAHELLRMAVLASDAFVEEGRNKHGELVVHGKPIEKAIVLAGLEAGLAQDDLAREHKRFDFLAFDSARRYGASLNENIGIKKNTLYISGAPEILFEHADYVWEKGKKKKMSKEIKNRLTDFLRKRSGEGMRIIGVAHKHVSAKEIPDGNEVEIEKFIKNNLIFVGFLVFSDPIRKDAHEAIHTVKRAGARVIMLTGDSRETAQHVAVEVGIAKKGDKALLGSDIETMDDPGLFKALNEVKIFARVLPQQKLRIARVLKDHQEVVAMTGDGINDAPALQSATIGVAVGSGTEVAKEASDIVLINNSFSIIVAAIAEGRKIIDNLKKIIAYLLSTSFSEIIIIGGALAAGAPLPILPGQILWANIIEEGFMSFAYAFEKQEEGIMRRDPRSIKTQGILSTDIKKLIYLVGIVTGVFLIIFYWILLQLDLPIEEIRTLMFAAISLDSIFFAFSFKSLGRPIWHINIFSNRYLLISLSLSTLLLLGALFLSPLQTLLTLTPLSRFELVILVGLGLFNLFVIEILKYFIFERQ